MLPILIDATFWSCQTGGCSRQMYRTAVEAARRAFSEEPTAAATP
jgi:hypothetical protein